MPCPPPPPPPFYVAYQSLVGRIPYTSIPPYVRSYAKAVRHHRISSSVMKAMIRPITKSVTYDEQFN